MVGGKIPLTLVVPMHSAEASAVDGWIFVAPRGSEWEVVEISEVHAVAGNDGGAVTADLVKADSGTAPGSGTSLLASTFNLKSTANTPVSKSVENAGISSALATRTIRSGQMLGINYGGTLTTLAGGTFTIVLKQRLPGVAR